jgi:hypothetical protein
MAELKKFNSSKNVLNEDLDNYEWFSLLRSEVDLSKIYQQIYQ